MTPPFEAGPVTGLPEPTPQQPEPTAQVIETVCAALRGFDGEPGNPGEMISVNEAQAIVRETLTDAVAEALAAQGDPRVWSPLDHLLDESTVFQYAHFDADDNELGNCVLVSDLPTIYERAATPTPPQPSDEDYPPNPTTLPDWVHRKGVDVARAYQTGLDDARRIAAEFQPSDALETRLRSLHFPGADGTDWVGCVACFQDWPCPTISLLGAAQGEGK
jgi:hypothetical protein